MGVGCATPLLAGESLVAEVRGLCLVEAKCLAVERKDKAALATFAVTRTYLAREGSVAGFQVAYSNPEGSSGPELWPPPSTGETSLWALRIGENGKWDVSCKSHFGTFWPVRDTEGSRYAQAKKLAETVEEVLAQDRASQLQTLRRSAFGDVPLVACWAISCLGNAQAGAGNEILEELSGNWEKLSVAAQIALDESLVKAWGDRWIRSAGRANMLSGWVLPEVLASDSDGIFSRLEVAYQRRQLGTRKLFWLVHSMVGDAEIPVAVRRRALFLGGQYPGKWNEDDRAQVFTLLTSVMRKEETAELRHAAAYVLRNSFVLSVDELVTVRSIQQGTKDEKLAAILGSITVPPAR